MLSKARIKYLRSLQQKKYRQQEQAFLVEGEKMVVELLQSGWHISQLICSPSFAHRHATLIDQYGLQACLADETQLTQIGSLSSNQQAVALVPFAQTAILPPATSPWVLLLDDINDPGNLGSLLRIADWFGIRQLVCSLQTVEYYSPKVIAASKGSFLRVAVSYQPLATYLASLPSGTRVLAADLQGHNIHQLEATQAQGGVLLLGSEAHGINPALNPWITQRVTIPAAGSAESLNVAVAAAIICDNLARLQSVSG